METKNFLKSRAIWGALLLIISWATATFFQVEITEEEQSRAVDMLIPIIEGATALIGFILVIVGRFGAEKKLTLLK